MWKDKLYALVASIFVAGIAFSQAYCLEVVGVEPVAESDTLYMLDVLVCDKWLDGKPTVLFRSVGYPDAKQLDYELGYHYLYKAQFTGSELEPNYVLTDSLAGQSIIAGDFDEDGNIEIIGLTSLYGGEGTEITTMKYKAGSWTTYKEAIPYYIERIIRVNLYNNAGDDFIFLFNALDLSQADSTNPEVESPPLGLIYGNWENQRLDLTVDSTIHNAIESIGSICEETTFVYIYEQLVDSTFVTLDGPRPAGALVKYRFNRESSDLVELYHIKTPLDTGEIVSDASSNLYVSDSLIQLLSSNLLQQYIDLGDSLALSLFQWTPFPCFNPVLIDIDGDGESELICAEPTVTDRAVREPNWVIKAYRLLTQ